MLDVVIAGGGIAGSALAIFLGRRGFEVEIFERAQFPREKTCGEGMMPAGVAVLERLGLAEAIGGTEFCGVRYHFGRSIAEGRFPQEAGKPATGRGQRRKHLDHVLLQEAARTSGVRVHTGVCVEGLLWEKGRVAGLLVGGKAERGRLVVAADGAHSRLRHALGLDVAPRRKRIGLRAHFRLAQGQEHSPWVEVFVSRGYELYITPLPERELLVAALADAEALEPPAERSFEKWRRAHPGLAARLDEAEQISPLAMTSPLSGRARSGVAPGVVLLGDAAGFVDPITGGGMTQALLAAELLAGHTAARLGADEAWLLEFERERRAMLRDYFALTELVLRLSKYPRLCEGVFAALAHVPPVFSHFIGVAAGMRKFLGPMRPAARAGFLQTAPFDLNKLRRLCVSEGKSAVKRNEVNS
jgi:flavin-dependent dehydrogenase